LRQVNEFGASEGPQRSNYRAVRSPENCIACGTCLTRCQAKAIVERSNDAPELRRDRCIGCGLCVTTCPADALALLPVPPGEWFDVPSSFEEWEERRLEYLSKTNPGRRQS
jgi:MinD superfamily P-loop ATPase